MENSHSVPLDTNESLENNEEKAQEVDTSSSSTVQHACMENKAGQMNNTKDIVNDYWNISDSEFQERILTFIDNDIDRKNKIQQWLETDHLLLQFIRQRSCLMAKVYSLKTEQDFWKTYNRNTQGEVDWLLSKMSKWMIKMNYISESFFKTQHDMKNRLKTIERQLIKAIEKLHQHMLHEQVCKLSPIDINFIFTTIIGYVRHNQQQLRIEYEQKLTHLMIIVNDIRLVKEFYDLKPNFLQTTAAKSIWQAIIDKQQMEKEMNKAQQSMCNDNDIACYDFLLSVTSDPTYANLTVNEFKERFLTEKIAQTKKYIEEYTRDIENEKELFLCSSQNEQDSTSPPSRSQTMLTIIGNREKTLMERVQLLNDFPKTFLDNENDDNDDSYDDDDDDYDSDESCEIYLIYG